tara:strand:- start:367 stop:1050 length:684 start_codon:yes stop_codon:yes gene_type:complete
MDSHSLRYKLLVLMVLQNSLTVLVGRFAQTNADPANKFSTFSLILVCELCKLVISAFLEVRGNPTISLARAIDRDIISRPKDFFKMLVPAGLYFVQNNILYVALNNLTAPVFQVTYQCKLLTTALMSVVMMNRKYNPIQWVALTTLGFGVAIVVLGENKSSEGGGGEEEENVNMVKGLFAVGVACTSSAFAGVYFEKVSERSGAQRSGAERSVWKTKLTHSFARCRF